MTLRRDASIAARLSPRARRRRLMRKRFLRRPVAILGLVVALDVHRSPRSSRRGSRRTRLGHRTSTRCSRSRRWDHLLGTDELGRDVLSRIIWGARASIQAGVLATLLAIVIGVPIGLVAGYYRGWIDPVISRLTDVVLAFPFLILAVGLAAILGPSLRNATIALGVGASRARSGSRAARRSRCARRTTSARRSRTAPAT